MQRPMFLMCAPTYFGVQYVINPWMEGQIGAASSEVALAQWHALYSILAVRGDIDLLAPVKGLPDLVFTANAALVYGRSALISSFRYPQRRGEAAHVSAWFAAREFEVHTLPPDVYFEGAGDALFDQVQPLLWFAHGIRSSESALPFLKSWVDVEVQPLSLLQSSFYHLDTCFCPLERGYLLYYPKAFDAASNGIIEARVPSEKRWAVSDEDAYNFACNAVNIGDHVILHRASDAMKSWLGAQGFVTVETPTAEFMKAGGSAKCLTLRLDTGPRA